MRPNDPTKEGCEFVGWCLQDGTAYDFDQIVTESITLYAQYSDEEGGSQLASKGTIMWTPITIICSVALLAGVGILVVSIKKGKTKKWQS